jgi:hypothetical protein
MERKKVEIWKERIIWMDIWVIRMEVVEGMWEGIKKIWKIKMEKWMKKMKIWINNLVWIKRMEV